MALKIPARKRRKGSRERKIEGRSGTLPEGGSGYERFRGNTQASTPRPVFYLVAAEVASPPLSDLSDQMGKIIAKVREAVC